jgi:DNA-binding transcriptional LysR family regulator
MQHLDNILVFVKIAEFESISKAARALGMPISTVSRKLSLLESELGVSLVRRTTRRVILTSQGREYFNQCIEPLTGPHSNPKEAGRCARDLRPNDSQPGSIHGFPIEILEGTCTNSH